MYSNLDSRVALLLLAAFSLLLSACGGGSSSGSSSATPSTSKATTAGVWKGSIVSTTTGQSSTVVALTGTDGHSVWMTTDGRTWSGQVPLTGDRFEVAFGGHMYDGVHFPDGTNHGTTSMMLDQHSASTMNGRYTGSGDTGTFNMALSPMWDRPASLAAAAGVYMRSTSNGYAMTLTISANGQVVATDSRGCLVNGTVVVPDPTHNLYRIDATVASCGSLDGTYSGMGTLLDADAMQDWMSAMHPLEQGGHSHGGSMMGGSATMGRNVVPTGQRNLFMFTLANERNAMMDALAR